MASLRRLVGMRQDRETDAGLENLLTAAGSSSIFAVKIAFPAAAAIGGSESALANDPWCDLDHSMEAGRAAPRPQPAAIGLRRRRLHPWLETGRSAARLR